MEAASAIDANVIPFCLLATSGALAGESIRPWTSGIQKWSSPRVTTTALEWELTAVHVSPKAWVVLAQMLLMNCKEHPIEHLEIICLNVQDDVVNLVTGSVLANPFPERWKGLNFPIVLDVSESFTVRGEFARAPLNDEQERIEAELCAWAPAVMIGAYGVSPVPPEKCVGRPQEDIVFIEDFMEWEFDDFHAHAAALDGLLNVFASVSQKMLPVTSVSVG